MAKVGFIGLGVMGSQMVDRLLSKGHTVTGYNRTRAKAEWLVEKGMHLGRFAARGRQRVGLHLRDGDQCRCDSVHLRRTRRSARRT